MKKDGRGRIWRSILIKTSYKSRKIQILEPPEGQVISRFPSSDMNIETECEA